MTASTTTRAPLTTEGSVRFKTRNVRMLAAFRRALVTGDVRLVGAPPEWESLPFTKLQLKDGRDAEDFSYTALLPSGTGSSSDSTHFYVLCMGARARLSLITDQPVVLTSDARVQVQEAAHPRA